ncbi:putative coiled-coil domain-containing protein 195 [Spea bombifrons]|uniref:putative coiled-coil domain-containing protein 195 n=1 Tax=Spea bombifrons TaxID=233779 RepID=UPI002349240E|nr:putative coiled-coil domain-containing protein 195 [Spea bombifrons]
MRSEIDKLERENKALREELSQLGIRTLTHKDQEISDDKKCKMPPNEQALSKGVLRRNVSAGSAQALQEQKEYRIFSVNIYFYITGVAMTVRRYSMSSPPLSSSGFHKQNVSLKRYSSSGTLGPNGSIQDIEQSTGRHDVQAKHVISENVLSNNNPKTRSFQEYVHQCRSRVKAVTFLLPTDMRSYAENQITIQSPKNHNANHLSTIIEKDP